MAENQRLEAACRKLRQTLDFRPSIHQVLEALEVAKQERLIRYTDRIEYFAKNHSG